MMVFVILAALVLGYLSRMVVEAREIARRDQRSMKQYATARERLFADKSYGEHFG